MIDAKRLDAIKRRAMVGDPVVGVGDTITNGELLELIHLGRQVAEMSRPVTDEEWRGSYWQKDGGMRSFVDAFIHARVSRVSGSRGAALSRSEDGQNESPTWRSGYELPAQD